MGVGVTDDNFDRLVHYSNFSLEEFDFTSSYKVDFIFKGSNFNGQDIIDIANLKNLWGQGVEEPYIAIEDLTFSGNKVKLMSPDKNPTLKITLPNGVSLIKFKSSQEEYEQLKSDLGTVTIDVIGKCECNKWNGLVSPQIIIEEYNIIGTQDYYF